MVLNKTEIMILKELNENSSLNIRFLSKKINLTERTIRYKVDKLNDFLEKNYLIGKLILNKGSIQLAGDICKINKAISDLEKKNYVFFCEERTEYLLMKILFSNSAKVEEVCNEIDVSRSTLKKNLKDLRGILKFEGLEIISKPKLGLILLGKEKAIRKLMLKKFIKYVDLLEFKKIKFKESLTPYEKTVNIVLENFVSTEINVEILFYCLSSIEKNMSEILSDEGYKIMIFYLFISIKRIKKNNILEEKLKNELFLRNTMEYSIICEELKKLEIQAEIKFNSEEFLQFTEYFLGTQLYNFSYSFYENWIQIETLVRELIENVNKKLNINIGDDLALEEGLINHLRPTIYRVKNGIKLENSIYEEVLKESSELFFLVKNSLKNLEKFIGIEIDNDEVAFISIYFKLAIDRNSKRLLNVKKIAIVCGFGYGTSRLIFQSIKDNFDVNIVDVVPYSKFIKGKMNEVDLIVSTLKFQNENNIPVIKVNPILTKENIETLEKFGLKKNFQNISLSILLEIIENNCEIFNKNKLKEELKNYIGNRLINNKTKKNKLGLIDFLPLKNIKIIEKAENWEEGVEKSGEILEKNGYTLKQYTEEMIKIIKKSGPYMIIGKDIILPHAEINKNVKKTGFAFLKLKKEVEFPNGNKIKNIISLASLSREEHINPLLELKKMIDASNFIKEINKVKDEKEIFDLIKKYC